jgi:glycosyltransferase involved in cell wall biosynthesis
MVLLIGNFPADQQQSMQRFAQMMLTGLETAGVPAELLRPQPFLGRIGFAGQFAGKWLGYIDKFVFFPRVLQRRLRAGVDLVHICDHSNAMYAPRVASVPVVVTCHDLLAVRGALGEVADCPASPTGKYLQRWIVSGLRKASTVVCASFATLHDAERIVVQADDRPKCVVIPHGQNYPYRKQPPEIARTHLCRIPQLDPNRPFVLQVGSNARMKNREGGLRIFARTRDAWPSQMVFAGEKLTPALRSLGKELGVADRLIEVEEPSNELLEALYSSALVLLHPSRFEGFGWPIIEAQACGCPVICSDREPMSDIGGEAALTGDVADENTMAHSILRLIDPAERARWSEKSLRNAERFQVSEMINRYVALYRSLGVRI